MPNNQVSFNMTPTSPNVLFQVNAGSQNDVQTAEAWAVGQRKGVDVGEQDVTYHNNSKYYALMAKEAEGKQPKIENGYWYVWDAVNEQWVDTEVPARGPQGETGETGATGATPVFSIGTVETGAAGTDAEATITGTAEEPVLNMKIPRGADGVGSVAGATLNGQAVTIDENNKLLLGNLKVQQTAVTDPTASGTAAAFIDSITQDAAGVITPTKKTVQSATQSQAGLMSAADKLALDTHMNNVAIVENGNTATQNIAKGQYVIWKGSLYVASSAIASGNTLSSSNLTAKSGGGLNDLHSAVGTLSENLANLSSAFRSPSNLEITRINNSFADATSIGRLSCRKVGSTVHFNGNLALASGTTSDFVDIAEISDWKCYPEVYTTVPAQNDSSKIIIVKITPNVNNSKGTVSIYAPNGVAASFYRFFITMPYSNP